MYNNNPYPDESIGTQPTEAYPPMEELQPRPPQPQYPAHAYTVPMPQPMADAPHMLEPVESPEDFEARQKNAMTVRFAIGKFNDYLLWFVMVMEVALTVRFLLKLIGADPNNLFAGFLYALTDIPLLPFLGIVKSPSIHPPNQAFEFSTLIAMIIYYLIFYALRRFFRLLVSNPEETAE
ncbi:MAG TPA: YggT family protein [Ktedonobacteraceae bacterium]|nr:YggT family protein [Ktedonobacteraceae bacterium]